MFLPLALSALPLVCKAPSAPSVPSASRSAFRRMRLPGRDAPSAPATDWPNVGGDKGGTRYSALAQINRKNIRDLQVAWMYHTGDAGQGTTIECMPIVVEGVMHVTSARSNVIALDAATGCPLWTFDPYAEKKPAILASGRGGKLGTASGDSFVAFALPTQEMPASSRRAGASKTREATASAN
ncbi:MAG TPA: hypothetical protein VFB38_05945 [Chthonomonadaceae bacterium]|nr:hypothetical protein [Chthonomonadaceae bacterium]